jgi:hypothetical protein
MFRNTLRFYSEDMLAPRQAPKLEDHPLSAVAATLHIGGRSSIRHLRTRHAVVTGTHLSRTDIDVLVTFSVDVLKSLPLFKKQ